MITYETPPYVKALEELNALPDADSVAAFLFERGCYDMRGMGIVGRMNLPVECCPLVAYFEACDEDILRVEVWKWGVYIVTRTRTLSDHFHAHVRSFIDEHDKGAYPFLAWDHPWNSDLIEE